MAGASTGHYPPPEEDEWTWLRAKADHLVDAAERVIEPPGADAGQWCKFCDRIVPCVLLNDFITHLQGVHGVSVTAVVLGDPSVLQTNVGPIASIILSCGHCTTVAKGNMYSILAMAAEGESHSTTVGRR